MKWKVIKFHGSKPPTSHKCLGDGLNPPEIHVLKLRATCCITPVRPDGKPKTAFFEHQIYGSMGFLNSGDATVEVSRHVGNGTKTDQHLLLC